MWSDSQEEERMSATVALRQKDFEVVAAEVLVKALDGIESAPVLSVLQVAAYMNVGRESVLKLLS